jgi:thiol-disulfide isomerase/thioredoxin
MEKKSFRIGLLIGIFISIIFYSFAFNKMQKIEPLKQIELKQIEIESLQKEKINLKIGKPIIINFWSTWCAPCIQEFPEFEKIKLKYGDKIEIRMVSDEKLQKILDFKNKNHYTLDIVRSLKSMDNYGIKSIPATYFYNSNGELVQKINRGLNENELNENIEFLLKK